MPHTFGFELEFADNVDALAAALQRKRLAYEGRMHRYHCDCGACRLDNGYPFRFQTDSTCGGECISRVFETIEEVIPLLSELQTSAVEVDAEPSLRAGMHVHVHPGRLGPTRLAKTFTAITLWEPALIVISSGRFERQRRMNVPIGRNLSNWWARNGDLQPRYDNITHPISGNVDYLTTLQRVVRDPTVAIAVNQAQDRHSNLNMRTRYNTWEHRWPNSTRVAWRMEMYIRVCLALFDSEVVNGLLSGEVEDLTETEPAEVVQRFADKIRLADPRCADLLLKQKQYMEEIVTAPPPAALFLAN